MRHTKVSFLWVVVLMTVKVAQPSLAATSGDASGRVLNPQQEPVTAGDFHVNARLRARCDDLPDKCETQYGYVKAFLAESRDAAWANQTERDLRNALLAKDPNIRFKHVECRKTLCVVELIVRAEVPALQPSNELGEKIHYASSVIAYARLGDRGIERDALCIYRLRGI